MKKQQGGQVGRVIGELHERRALWIAFLQEKVGTLRERVAEFGLDVEEEPSAPSHPLQSPGDAPEPPPQPPSPSPDAIGGGDWVEDDPMPPTPGPTVDQRAGDDFLDY